MHLKFFNFIAVLFLSIGFLSAQTQAPENWFTMRPTPNGPKGADADRVYTELLKALPSAPVIVAVIDSGVEIDHEDLKGKIWVNKKEIPGNKIDDDGNGYIDDVYGWNFLGNANGQNVGADTYEVTRLYASLKDKYEKIDTTKLSKSEKKEFELYKQTKEEVKKKKEFAQANVAQYEQTKSMLMEPLYAVKRALGRKPYTLENIQKLEAGDDEKLEMGRMISQQILASGDFQTTNIDSVITLLNSELDKGINHFKNQVDYAYNPDFNPRKTIVKDDENNYAQKGYGNNDVEGPDAMHGTHVAGIIGANRNNKIGIRGIADNCLIMSVRAVPDGDERDKDVANAIRYAVDNGAKVINMSFGKGFSPGKKYVDEAVKYAAKKDVLLVHAAGNSAENNDTKGNYPNDIYANKSLFGKKKAANWIEVGALTWMSGEDQVADFSNYGKANVDIFAPGYDIYSTVPDQKYESANGTSMASPVVAGVATMIRSYFPTLSAVEVKDILLQSATKITDKVRKPGSDELVTLDEISVTGGYVNAYEAVKLAAKKAGVKLPEPSTIKS